MKPKCEFCKDVDAEFVCTECGTYYCAECATNIDFKCSECAPRLNRIIGGG